VYLFFISIFHSTRESLITQGGTYKMPIFQVFYDFLIRKQDNLLHIGVISTVGVSNKVLVAQ
jgi:hypothetical protein